MLTELFFYHKNSKCDFIDFQGEKELFSSKRFQKGKMFVFLQRQIPPALPAEQRTRVELFVYGG